MTEKLVNHGKAMVERISHSNSKTSLSGLVFGFTTVFFSMIGMIFPNVRISGRGGLQTDANGVYACNTIVLVMSLFYVIMSYREQYMFLIISVPLRMLSCVFLVLYTNYYLLAVWELIGAVITGYCCVTEDAEMEFWITRECGNNRVTVDEAIELSSRNFMEIIHRNPLVIQVKQDENDPGLYQIADEIDIAGGYKSRVEYSAKFTKTQNGYVAEGFVKSPPLYTRSEWVVLPPYSSDGGVRLLEVTRMKTKVSMIEYSLEHSKKAHEKSMDEMVTRLNSQ